MNSDNPMLFRGEVTFESCWNIWQKAVCLSGGEWGVTETKAQEVGQGQIPQGIGDQDEACLIFLKTQREAVEF